MELALNDFYTPQQAKEERKAKIIETLNDAQKAVVQNYKGYSMVSAGPGSGRHHNK